jgi:hypothetical protein
MYFPSFHCNTSLMLQRHCNTSLMLQFQLMMQMQCADVRI